MTKAIIDAVLDEPELVGSIDILPENKWQRFLIWLRIRKAEKRELYLKGATASTMYQISKLLLSIRTISEEKDEEGRAYDLINSNVKHVVLFVAIAIHNSVGRPPQWLIDGLDTQFSMDQLKAISDAAYERLGIESFFGILVSLRNPDLNLIDTREIPAPSQPSAE